MTAPRIISTRDLTMDDTRMPKWARAKARVLAGLGNGKIAVIGDSTVASTVGRSKSFPDRIAKRFNQLGLAARSANGFFTAGQTTTAGYAAYNPEFTFGAGWGLLAASSLGGVPLVNSTNANAITWTPSISVDRFYHYWFKSNGYGSIDIDVDGGAATNIVTGGQGEGLGVTSIDAASLGTHTLNIKRSSGSAGVVGVMAVDTSVFAIDVINLGWLGSTTATWAQAGGGQGWLPKNALVTFAPDLTLIKLGYNDYYLGVTVTDYEANLRTLITAAQQTGDCGLIVSPQVTTTRGSTELQLQFRAVLLSLAAELNLPIFDHWARRISFANNLAMGYLEADQLHASDLGYADEAMYIAEVLAA